MGNYYNNNNKNNNFNNKNNSYNKSNNFNNNNRNNQKTEEAYVSLFAKNGVKVDEPLSKCVDDAKDLYLPEGKAYKCAERFKKISNSQLRKILDAGKQAVDLAERDEFEQAQAKIFMLVTISAYNSGRMSEVKPLYEFLKDIINEDSIKTVEDIVVFDKLFTSIIAYHKVIGGKN